LVGRFSRTILLLAGLLVLALGSASSAGAVTIAPPWCGTPEPDAAAALPDGSNPTDPVGSFPHIPYYALGCTLEAIAAESNGRMTVETIGHSAQGRPMYAATINALDTHAQEKGFERWQKLRRFALNHPADAQAQLAEWGDAFKIPIYIQAGIHGNEYEGVDATMLLLNRLATTPYGTDPFVDRVLDNVILVVNIDQNPDGRAIGQRANGFNFDLNRDFLTQSQSETKASVGLMQKWLFPDMLDQHGYVTPTLVEATTKPHNPGIDYDLWLRWNQPRTLANKVALADVGLGMQRPVNEWCPDADLPPIGSTTCAGGVQPGPAVAEGWDDWGPFYTPMYNQLVGLNGSTVEMCSSLNSNPATQRVCGAPGLSSFPRGRLAARLAQYTVATSTLEFDIANRQDLMHDLLQIYRRGDNGEPRPPCCPAPFDVANNWMHEYPTAFVIPRGVGQRSDPEASRLVGWLLTNGIEVSRLEKDYTFGPQSFATGSYVIWMNQAHRGLADTALDIGVDVSSQIGQLYAPPGAWSHGYLWGASLVTIPNGAAFAAKTKQIDAPEPLSGGVAAGTGDRYALTVDSPTAVRVLNELVGDGVATQLALASFTSGGNTYPAGSAIFQADAATQAALNAAGSANGVLFHPVSSAALPALDAIDRVPRIAVLTAAVNQDVWVLRNLGFTADPIATGTTSQLNNPAAADPLANYDVVFNTAGWPSGLTARARLTAFFVAHGGYIGAGANGGAAFLTSAAQVSGLVAASQGGAGRSGIIYWNNLGGANSPIVGAYPTQDTAIVDPPTWFTSTGSLTVDARLPMSGFFAAGLWQLALSPTAPGSALIAHGTNTAGTARLTMYAMNPLYRADPEREWPSISTAAYWADQ
jgi:hypothetical protein